MSLMRLRRLQRLEALRRPEVPVFDYAGSAIAGRELVAWFQANITAVASSKACALEFMGRPSGCVAGC